ncbi:MAG: DHA2 family efflux MFS transporter permease subunit [Acidobacteria bacterium]|nr:DHA2 family efflux MFS transporter permease subunit [Acidobacteriota bacterium]
MIERETLERDQPSPPEERTAIFMAPIQLPHMQRRLITIGVMTGMFLGALEGTVVGTAMPTVVARLGGIDIYSWVFSIYLLTSTVTMPLWGKLSDLYGRRRFYLLGVGLFLFGSVLSGQSNSMHELIGFRAIQGLGAGALVPLGLTMIGDIYSLTERARMQGLFSGVWGMASMVGPLVGGLITDHISWRWVFYLNVPFGLAAVVIIGLTRKEPRTERQVHIDARGVITFATAITLFLLALMEGGRSYGWTSPTILSLFAASIFSFWLFLSLERNAPEPIIPLSLFRENRLFRATAINGLLAGMAMFGSISFIPLFVQGVIGTSATRAGSVLIPLTIGWTSWSVVSSRLLLRVGYRPLVIAGMCSLTIAFLMLIRLSPTSSWLLIYSNMFLVGMGMGLSMVTLLIAVQNSVQRQQMGIATSATQFFRIIGGAIGVAIMGTVMTLRMKVHVVDPTISPNGNTTEIARLLQHPDALIDPMTRGRLSPEVLTVLQGVLADALHGVFWVGLIVAVLALGSAFLVPKGRPHEHAVQREPILPLGERN